MSTHDQHHNTHTEARREPNPADMKADAIAAFCMVVIAVAGVLFYISQHHN